MIIKGGAPGISLSGCLALPARAHGPNPAVLLVTGNGPHTREQVVSGCPMFRMIADHLVSSGIAVLSVDPRGYGFSTGPDELQTTSADRELDARACLEALRREPQLDRNRIGIIGHSEGAMIALMLAAETDLANFVVLLGCPGEPCGPLWVEQKVATLRTRGAEPATVDAVRAAFLRFVDLAAKGFDSDDAYYAAGKDVLRAHGVKDAEVTNQFVDRIVSDLRSPHYRYFLGWDPAKYLNRVDEPTLAIWGALDEQVPPARNAPIFQRLRDGSPARKFTVTILPDEDHFFLRRQGVKPGAKHEYGRMHVSPAMLSAMTQWINALAAR
jgi:pimeloyl-ACP methyl ester carboxylesterase